MTSPTESQGISTKNTNDNEFPAVDTSSQEVLLAQLDAMQAQIANGEGVPLIQTAIDLVRAGKLDLAINHIKNDSDKLHSYPPILIAKLEEVLGIEIRPKFPWQ